MRKKLFEKTKRKSKEILERIAQEHPELNLVKRLGEHGLFINSLLHTTQRKGTYATVGSILEIYKQERKNVEFLLANAEEAAAKDRHMSVAKFKEIYEDYLEKLEKTIAESDGMDKSELRLFSKKILYNAYQINLRVIRLILGEELYKQYHNEIIWHYEPERLN
jgi:hypothetical protein